MRAELKSIFVTFQKEGIHCYPEALTDPALNDVSFLGHPHRHIFHFRVDISVTGSNRDIEFIQFKRWLGELYSGGVLQLNNKSCEMMASDLCDAVLVKYPSSSYVAVSVAEDNENGATIVRMAHQ